MKKTIILICFILASISALAQTITIEGSIKDSRGEAIIGAVVVLEGNTKYNSVSDSEGKYSITIPASEKNPVLNVSCLSYRSQSIKLNGASVKDFILEDDTEQLGEAVVVGYGSMRRSDLTGSVASVRMDENKASQVPSLDKFLQGKAAGVQVISNSAAPDAGVSVRIRGMSTFSGTTEPLYVVDGVILNTSASTSIMSTGIESSGSNDKTNELIGINPKDIASIEILKDASATAIYGSQGSNGVVLITTKSAQKDKPVVKLTMGMGVSNRYKKMDVLDFWDWIGFSEAADPRSSSVNFEHIFADPIGKKGLLCTPMDWQDYVERTALSENVYLSVSGRPKKTSYWMSLGINNTEGIIKKTGFSNYTMRLNLDRELGKKVRIGVKTGLSYLDSDMTQGASAGTLTAASSLMRSMISSAPRMFDDNESEALIDPMYLSGPDKWLADFQNKKYEIRVNPSAFIEYKVLPYLTFKSILGADYRSIDQYKFRTTRISYSTTGSTGAKGHINQLYCNWSNMFMLNKSFGKHTLSGTLGTEYSSNNGTTQTVEGWNIEQYKSLINSINSAPNASFDHSNWNNALMSFYIRAIYNFNDRHILTATYRMDGSSKFRGENKWAHFPSFAYAWRASEEPWVKEIMPHISVLKFRIGWGQVGNQAISNYQTMQNYSNTLLPDHTPGNTLQANVGTYPSNISNPDLKWETSEQTNLGLDLGLFKGRVAFTVDAYYKVTKDLLQYKKIPSASGFTGLWMNYGNIENKGLEFTLETTPVKTKLVEWSLNGNISFNRNRVLSIGDKDEGEEIWVAEGKKIKTTYFYGNAIGNSSYVASPLNIFIEGYPMGVFYGLKSDGIVQIGEEGIPVSKDAPARQPGYIKYVDINGDGYISEDDRIVIGDPNPDFTFGFGTSLSIGDFTVSLDFNGSWGNDIFNVNKVIDSDVKTITHNVLTEAYRRAWTPENRENYYPGLGKMETLDFNSVSDRYVEDGSYLRFSSVALSYEVPLKKSDFFVKGLNITLNANNLIFWTKYSGFDPDVNSFGSTQRMGADMGSYPGAREYNFRLNFTF